MDGSSLLKGLNGKSTQDAADIIGQRIKLAEPPKIELSPSWWPRLPYFGFRLALFVQAEPNTQVQTGAAASSP